MCAGEEGAANKKTKHTNHPTNRNADQDKMQSEDANERDDTHAMTTEQRGGLFENTVISAVKCQLQLQTSFTEPLLEYKISTTK